MPVAALCAVSYAFPDKDLYYMRGRASLNKRGGCMLHARSVGAIISSWEYLIVPEDVNIGLPAFYRRSPVVFWGEKKTEFSKNNLFNFCRKTTLLLCENVKFLFLENLYSIRRNVLKYPRETRAANNARRISCCTRIEFRYMVISVFIWRGNIFAHNRG